jgi:hypothetical protein
MKFDSKLEQRVAELFPQWKYHADTIQYVSQVNQRKVTRAGISPGETQKMLAQLAQSFRVDFTTPKGNLVEVKGLLDERSKVRWNACPHVIHLLSVPRCPPLDLVMDAELFDTVFRTRLLAWYKALRGHIPQCMRQGLWLPLDYKDNPYLIRYGNEL